MSMSKMNLINKQKRTIIFDFIILYIKYMFGIKLNYYDKYLDSILDEYDYIYEYKKDWKRRYE